MFPLRSMCRLPSLRRGGKKVPLYVDRLDEALRVAENGQKIFIKAGMYTVSQGGFSYYVLGKNVSMVGASTKDCALLYQNTETPAPAPVPGQPQPRQEAHL